MDRLAQITNRTVASNAIGCIDRYRRDTASCGDFLGTNKNT